MSDETYEQYTRLEFERPGDGVLLITLDDPDKLNATDGTMHLQLVAGLSHDRRRRPPCERSS